MLIEEGAPAGVYDDSMNSAMAVMIQKMPNVVSNFYNTVLNQSILAQRSTSIPPKNVRKTFPELPGGIEMEHWAEMGLPFI